MSSMEDKLASLFRRVRRLQVLRLLGDLFSTALTDTISMSSYVFSALWSPYRLFEDFLVIEEFLKIAFGGRHVQEYLDISPVLNIIYDAFHDTLSSVGRIRMGLSGILEGLSLAEDILYLFLLSGSVSEELLYHIEIKLLEALDEISKNLRAVLYIGEDVSVIEVLRPRFRLSADLEDISEILHYLIKIVEGIESLGLLYVSLLVSESMSILEQIEIIYFSLIGETDIETVLGARVMAWIVETLEVSGTMLASIRFIEDTIDLGDSMEPLFRLQADIGIGAALTFLASVTQTLYGAFPTMVSKLYAGLMITGETVSVADVILAHYFDLIQDTIIGEALGSEITNLVIDTLAEVGKLYAGLMTTESISMSEQIDLFSRLVQPSSLAEVLTYVSLVTDTIIEIITESGNLMISMSELLESVAITEEMQLDSWLSQDLEDIVDVLTYLLSSLPALTETLGSVGYLIAGMSILEDDIAIADSMRPAGKLSQDEKIGTRPDAYVDWDNAAVHLNWSDHLDHTDISHTNWTNADHENVPYADSHENWTNHAIHLNWTDHSNSYSDSHSNWTNADHENVPWQDGHNNWTNSQIHLNWTDHSNSYTDSHSNWTNADHENVPWQDGHSNWTNSVSYQDWTDHSNTHSNSHTDWYGGDHEDSHGDSHSNHSDHTDSYTQWNDAVFPEQHLNWTDSYSDHGNWTDSWHLDHTDHGDSYTDTHSDHTDDPHQDDPYQDSHTNWTDITQHVNWTDYSDSYTDSHSNWTNADHENTPYQDSHTNWDNVVSHVNWADHSNSYSDTHSNWTNADHENTPYTDEHGNWVNDVPHVNWTDHSDDHTDTHTNWTDADHENTPHTDMHVNWIDQGADDGLTQSVWGRNQINTSNAATNFCRAMGGTSPSTVGHMKTISIYCNNAVGNVRVAIYQGGSLATGPEGARLIVDAGIIPLQSGWATISVGTVEWENSYPTWIAWKGNDNTREVRYESDNSGAGHFQTARGRWNSQAISTDETVAFPSAWPSDPSGSFNSFWYSMYLTYVK